MKGFFVLFFNLIGLQNYENSRTLISKGLAFNMREGFRKNQKNREVKVWD